MKYLLSALIILLITSSAIAQEKEIWRNPEVFAINKEPAHAEFIHFENRDEAIAPLNLENPWNSKCYKSLNGEWDFNWYGNINNVPTDWYATNSKVAKWDTMPVPGIWQNKGYDQLYYLNVTMPFEYDWNTGARVKGFREDEIEQSKETGYIPESSQTIGCYRKWVNIPAERVNERVILRIGAVEAGVQVFVNGSEVAYSQGSMTPAEFEISDYLEAGKNLIALKVLRWTDGSYMEVQDMIRFAGIYRDVFLRYEPKQHIQDVQFIGTPDKSLKTITSNYSVKLQNNSEKQLKGAQLKFKLLDNATHTSVKIWNEEVKHIKASVVLDVSGNIQFNDLKLWSPDLPNIYTLLVSLIDAKGKSIQVTRSDVGFKRFEEINGKPPQLIV